VLPDHRSTDSRGVAQLVGLHDRGRELICGRGPPAGEHLPSGPIRSLLAARDGRLWTGTTQGLASWKDGKLTHYPEVAGQVRPLLEDREGTVWAGGFVSSTGRLCTMSRNDGRNQVRLRGPGLRCDSHPGAHPAPIIAAVAGVLVG
jgi:Two component regulator propeller